jgi:RNA polymerase sigma-70 factor (ECF subfamily)
MGENGRRDPDSKAQRDMNTADFDSFFTERYTRASRFACALLGAADAEDAVQDAFTRLLLRWNRCGSVVNLEAYFFRILYNVCRTRLRRRRFRQTVLALFRPPAAANPPGGEPDLSEVWRTFSPREQAVFCLVDYQGWPPEEAARALGMAPATLRVHRHRLRQKIVQWEARP